MCVYHWSSPVWLNMISVTHNNWSWISSWTSVYRVCGILLLGLLIWWLVLILCCKVAALFLMADCHTVSPLSLTAVQSHAAGLELCISSFYSYFFSPLCLSLVCFNKLITCQLLTDPTQPESIASVDRP